MYHTEIASLQARIVRAEAERDASFSRHQVKYADACARIDRLSLQLWDLRLAHLREHVGAPLKASF